MYAVGLDIGGANLKAADADGRAVSRPFPIWNAPEMLSDELRALLREFETPDVLAVTMTAELADCFRTKADGVARILAAVEIVAGDALVRVWQTGAEFVDVETAREIPRLVAASNWHALATFAGRSFPRGASLLVDVGSTTTDVVPISDGAPVPDGFTDRERLETGELVYTGVRRTPLCAVAHTVPLRNGYCPLAAELFATTLDVYLLLGDLPEDKHDCDTANRLPATVDDAHARLARMLCCDAEELPFADVLGIARFLADVQMRRIAGPLERVASRLDGRLEGVIVSGSGSFLAERVVGAHPRCVDAEVVSLSHAFAPETSAAACAFAVARLAAERT